MSETREMANAAMDQAILRLVGDIAPFDYAQGRLRQDGRFHAAAGENVFRMCPIGLFR
jgi:hypothetical protein